MNYTSNYNLNLPQESDFVRTAPLNTNFTTIDTALKENAEAIKNVKVPTDQTYNPKSTNAQSGKAVAWAIEQALKNVEIDVDYKMSSTSGNPVQNKVVKAYVDKKNDISLEDDETLKISFSKEDGKLIATVKSDTPEEDEPQETDALDVIAYEKKTYRDIFVTNNLFPIGDFENGLGSAIVTSGSPEIVSGVYNSGSHSLRILSTKDTGHKVKYNSVLSASGATIYGACMVRVDKFSGGKVGLRLSSGDKYSDAWITTQTSKFEKVSTTLTAQNVGCSIFVGSNNGPNMTAYIDDVVVVDLSIFSTTPNKEEMDELYDTYIRLLTGGGSDDTTVVDPNRFVISGEPFNIAKVVEEGNNNPVTSDAVYKALQEVKEDDNEVTVESAFDYTKYNLPILYLTGDTSQLLPAQDKPEGTFTYKYLNKQGSCTLKYQGSSSLNYPKKNYTIKFDNKFEAKEGWGEQKKYCLKANYIDFSHARNVVSAKLWGKVVKDRTNVDTHLANLVNGGAVDGFPVLVVINDVYQGLYTFNIPKDKWMFNVEDGDNCLVLPVDGYSTATDFSALETSLTDDDGKGFEIEYAPDNMTESEILNRLNAFIGAVVNCNKITDKTAKKTDFEANVKPLMDFESFVDYVIFQSLITGSDNGSKNYILTDYYDNGVDKWGITAYDMDSTYGLKWDGKAYLPINNQVNLKVTNNKLLGLIVSLYPEEIKARYETLRTGVMAESNVQLEFYNFTAEIPKAIKDEECKLWSLIPNTDTNNVNQIVNQYILRCKYIDEQASKL